MTNGKVILAMALIVAGSLVGHRSRTSPFRIRMEGSLGWCAVHAEEPKPNPLFRRLLRRIRLRLPSV